MVESEMKRKIGGKKIGPAAKKDSISEATRRAAADHPANTAIGPKAKPKRFFNLWFATVAATISKSAGSPIVFFAALIFIVIWAVSGPYLGFSAGWQMILNAGTGISTFLMVFIIQNSQNRDDMALHIKLDEIIRALHGANNKIINLQTLSHEELEHLQTKFATIGSTARRKK
jgi:low affinity Fe/Cu permease